MIVTKCWCIKLLTIIGLSTLLWVEHHSVFRQVPSLLILQYSSFWHSLGVIGAIIYLMGAECTKCTKNEEPVEADIKADSKGKQKKN